MSNLKNGFLFLLLVGSICCMFVFGCGADTGSKTSNSDSQQKVQERINKYQKLITAINQVDLAGVKLEMSRINNFDDVGNQGPLMIAILLADTTSKASKDSIEKVNLRYEIIQTILTNNNYSAKAINQEIKNIVMTMVMPGNHDLGWEKTKDIITAMVNKGGNPQLAIPYSVQFGAMQHTQLLADLGARCDYVHENPGLGDLLGDGENLLFVVARQSVVDDYKIMVSIYEYLIGKGANPTIKNKKQQTVADAALDRIQELRKYIASNNDIIPILRSEKKDNAARIEQLQKEILRFEKELQIRQQFIDYLKGSNSHSASNAAPSGVRYAFEMKDSKGFKYYVHIFSKDERPVDSGKRSWFGASRQVFQGEYFVSIARNKERTGGTFEGMLFPSYNPIESIFDLEDNDRKLNSAYVVDGNSGQPDVLVVSQRQAATSGWLVAYVIDGGVLYPMTFALSDGVKSVKIESHTPFRAVGPNVFHSSAWSNAILESGADRRGGIYYTWRLNLADKIFEKTDEMFVSFRQPQPQW